MNTCDACKWWGGPERERDRMRICSERIVGGVQMEGDDRMEGAECASLDAIFTGPKFGCIHWEKKPSNEMKASEARAISG